MRIIGGKYRGKKLFTPQDMTVRPTADRAREALFNILYSRLGDLSQTSVLDVFAGTGAFGLEALSRGAGFVAFMDLRPALAKKNVALFEAEKDKIEVITADATRCLPAKRAFNLIFSDAPYAKNLSVPAMSSLAKNGWIAEGALCLIETRHDEVCPLPDTFVPEEERIYGLAKIGFYTFRHISF